MSRVIGIVDFPFVVMLPYHRANWKDAKHPEDIRKQDSCGPFLQKLLPASAFHREVDAHTGNKE
jgi:hypothetical protein